jgi:asparagine synthase (glutamine-hydrolysing)
VKLVTKKIKSQIDSDYPIGILLSGGLDSSFIAAIACTLLKKENKKLIAFSIILPEDNKGEDKDERQYIEKMESFYDNLEVHYISIPADIGPYSNLTSAFEHVESPVNTLHYADISLYEHAKKHNVRTLLTGFGGDMTLSHPGYGVIFQYLSQLRLLRAAKIFKRRHKETKRTLYNHFKHEVLSHIPLLKRIESIISKNNDYPSLSLNKKYISRIISSRNARSYMYNRSYAGSINTGELGSLLLKIRKLSNAFQLEFISTLLSKEITELFMAVPGEELIVKGQQRSLIKGAMKGIVPEEIISRIDKLPFSPDGNKRIVKITPENIAHWLANKDLIESNTGIVAEEHLKLISKINPSDVRIEWPINKNIFYIPMIVIAAEFYIWLSKKIMN